MRPWEYCSELTRERLVKIAQLLAIGRGDAVDRYDPTIGDDNWTLGVCAYNYGCFQIKRFAGTSGFEWLSVIEPGKYFQFSIAGVPMRFWRGDPSDPVTKISIATPHEQLLLGLEPSVLNDGMLFRIGVTIDEDGALLGASFVALRNGQPETVWPLPLADAEPLLILVDDRLPEGRELSPPSVGGHWDDDEVNAQADDRPRGT